MASNQIEDVDIIVVGAGFAGLAAAKEYLQCAPDTNLILFDSYATIGGVWSQERIYPGLQTNNLLGTFEFPDFPMEENFGAKPGHHIPALAVHKYLAAYAQKFGFSNRIRYNSTVVTAEKEADGSWILDVKVASTSKESARQYSIRCSKMIVSTGLTSQVENIHYPHEEAFKRPLLHSAKLASEGALLATNTPEGQRQITVLGGSKSAYDAVFMFASRGFDVNWVIRKSGYGPTWMAPTHIQAGPASLRVEYVPCTRALTWFSPSIWSTGSLGSWMRSFLHATAIGRLLVKLFWTKLGGDVVHQTHLNSSAELQKLKPDESVLWYATSLAILNYDSDIHDFVRSGQVKIHRQDIHHLDEAAVVLEDGTVLASPAGMVTATPWQWAPNIEFRPASIHAELGIPSTSYSAEQRQTWADLDKEADSHVLAKLPALVNAPQHGRIASSKLARIAEDGRLEPYRLYRFLAPPGLTVQGDRSIVFQGFTANLLNQVRNELTGLWAYAYLNNRLDIDLSQVKRQAALDMRFMRLRYPFGFGSKYPDFVFEQVPYFDQLLLDLGLQCERKGSWFKEVFEPYGQADYRGVTEEWLARQKKTA